jgi:hypothetical protein
VLRISETLEIEVDIIESREAPGGVGEPGLAPVAPALGNAIFASTAKPAFRYFQSGVIVTDELPGCHYNFRVPDIHLQRKRRVVSD